MPSILVLGSSNTDLVVRGERLPAPGETVTGGEFFRAAGGKGANQAVAAARAGAHVTFIGAVGDDDYGLSARSGLTREGIDRRYVKTSLGVASGIALIMVDSRGENLISVAAGANALLSAHDIEHIPDAVFRQANLFLACLESPLPAVAAGLRRAKQAGVRTMLNPAPATVEASLPEFLSLVDIIVPNRDEAVLLTGCDTRHEDGLLAAACKFRDLGCPVSVVTLGREGCFVFDGQATRVPACDVKAIDSTGAGDTFCGNLAVALAEGVDLPEAALWASRAAAISVTRRGAQPSIPYRHETEAFAWP